ncbi:SMC-Scp complex subunit ScpB [Streptococcus sp. DD12]|uniref:SMC-Scp complex subunit ScpB n=1 Tax=Streptococcus sp. DD12 TaxID=1777880 RepID=UPI00079A01AF|nr:SMC-Scp complex subunit ScpB [Streptococcus sp. DD12]KXT75663.1 Segregation and condensation protein B [Streptococcus sp. DD12]
MTPIAQIEALLYVAGEEGLTLRQLSDILDMPPTGLVQSLESLAAKYQADPNSAFSLLESANSYKLVTKEAFAPLLHDFSNSPVNQSLSRAALETLAIIAYRQPVTRAEVDDIRGVNSSGAITKLLALHLIQEAGKKETLGRPNLYATTDYFLDYLGINSLDELVDASSLVLDEDSQQILFEEEKTDAD